MGPFYENRFEKENKLIYCKSSLSVVIV